MPPMNVSLNSSLVVGFCSYSFITVLRSQSKISKRGISSHGLLISRGKTTTLSFFRISRKVFSRSWVYGRLSILERRSLIVAASDYDLFRAFMNLSLIAVTKPQSVVRSYLDCNSLPSELLSQRDTSKIIGVSGFFQPLTFSFAVLGKLKPPKQLFDVAVCQPPQYRNQDR